MFNFFSRNTKNEVIEPPKTYLQKAQRSDNLISQFYYGTSEKTFEESSYNEASQLKPYNPSDLYQKTGTHEIYEDMVKDDQVSSCLQLKKDMVLGSGWDIVLEDESHEEIKAFLESNLDEMLNVPFHESLEEILSAYEFGFSLTEKVFAKKDSKLILKSLKTRHPDTWLMYTDVFGNIEKIEQQGIDKIHQKINLKSLIHYVNKRKFQNPYGNSDLESAYAAYFTKRQIIRYYGIFLEKAASPTPIAKYNPQVPDAAVTKLFNTIKSFQAKTALTVPSNVEIEFLEAKSNGDAFIKGINLFNLFIGRSLLIPDLLGLSGSETTGGSLALGSQHLDLFFKHVARRRLSLEKMVNNEIIKPIIVYNYGFVEGYPKFKLKPLDEEDVAEYAKLWIEAVKSNVYKPNDEEINHFRNIINYPKGEVEHREVPRGTDIFNPKPEIESPKQEQSDKPDTDKEIQKEFAKPFKNPEGDYYKKTDFKVLETALQHTEDKVKTEAHPVVDKIFRDLVDQITKKKIVQNNNIDRIDTIKLKYLKEFKQILNQNLKEQYVNAQKIAEKEIFKSNFAKPLPADEFLEVLDKENFNYVGDWEYQVTKDARIEMINAIKEGKPLSEVVDVVETGIKNKSLVSLERYSRTKTTEVMNQARKAFFEDSGVVSGYQYSAVMDAATTDICQGLHGKKFKKGTEPTPPMHFNCRSVLIPITIYEEFKPDTKVGKTNINDFINKNAGKGFGGTPIRS